MAVIGSLTACAPVVDMRPAPEATTVACAGVVVRLRDSTLGSLGYRSTDAQGTLAWGDPVEVSLTCGTTNPPPSAECVTFDDVDWARTTTGKYVRYDTYGRDPNVTVLTSGSSVDPVTVLSAISGPVLAAIPRSSGRCGG